ncbi:TPA: hypothetical protein ACTU9V_004496, partial [Escherichia coli]
MKTFTQSHSRNQFTPNQRWIHTGEYESASDAKRFLDTLVTGHCACMVTPSPVLDHDTWLRIRLLMGEIRDA